MLRQVLGTLALFAALVLFGLVTRPAALALPRVFGFHAVLVALPSAFALTFSLRKGLRFPLVAGAVVLFSLLLSLMSPVMGVSSLAPMAVAALAYGGFRKGESRKAFAVGCVYGAFFYPCTVAASLGLGALSLAYLQGSVFVLLAAALLGGALAVLGAVSATGLADRR
ncbi:hypothetical protein VJ923_03290 [Adlercreutzia sp. R25]|uniref:Uncharacterized protein n=1 Tax=Adlercreutzia shanghongiae TaxID=3111773 RepID=A0ABU6IVR0_9ACTN|nr:MULTISPECIES: hypothetical protein [unclassified Adlercreutzia]MEC4272183.1 hypothetical protein [Adlercreutzia sp. R25]MEC4293906.1 hypothetical protein [Adlercreutzia sp. R22]